MIAAVLHGHRDLRIDDIDAPEPQTGEVLLKVAAVGVCGTDYAEWWLGPNRYPVDRPHPVTGHHGPLVLGHEFSGTVKACGPGVNQEWMGRRVASSAALSCGECRLCRDQRSNLCERYHGIGLHRHGALAQFVTAPVQCLLDITGSNLSLDVAALAQPMAIAHHAVRRGAPKPEGTVLVQGIGGVGAFIVRVLVERGHRVLAVDMARNRLDVAATLGAHECLLTSGGDDDRAMLEMLIATESVETAFEVSGTSAGLRSLQGALSVGGRIVLVGIQKRGSDLDLGSVTLREQELIGTNGLVHSRDLPAAVRTLEDFGGDWGVVAPKVFAMAGLTDSVLLPMSGSAEERPIKALIDPWTDVDRPLAVADVQTEFHTQIRRRRR